MPDRKSQDVRSDAAFSAIEFLTVIGRGGALPTQQTLEWFPAVGFGIGMAIEASWRLARRRRDALPSAAIAVLTDAIITGALHIDGLADSADGLLSHLRREDRLRIMAEPELGTFGNVAIAGALIARVAALEALEPSPALLGAFWMLSRSMMALGTRAFGPYARDGEGTASAFLSDESAKIESTDRVLLSSVAGVSCSLLLAALSKGGSGFRAALAGVAAGSLVLALGKRQLGGFTGDVLGAAGIVSETVALLCASKQPKTSS